VVDWFRICIKFRCCLFWSNNLILYLDTWIWEDSAVVS
jgi:hypothetical protein